MARPETHYARSGDVHVAWQAFGQGPVDLVWVPGFISNLELHWEDAGLAHVLSRLGAFARVVQFDKRGTGLSDPVTELPALEQRMDDVRAVMDAAGVQRAVLLGASEGAPMAMLFAATYPERTHSLVLYGAYARFHDAVLSPERLEAFISAIDADWGSGASLRHFAPSRVADPAFAAWWARFERLGASPRAAVALARMNAQIDVRDVLPLIRVPTLVLHRAGDVRVNVESGRMIGATIPGARYVELAGRDHPIWTGDTDAILDEVEYFVTGTRHAPAPNHVLATVLAAEPTEAESGPEWPQRLARWRSAAATEVERYSGRLAGPMRADGALLATFDGPARAVRCAAALRALAEEHLGHPLRAGLHAGEISIIESETSGPALHVALRIANLARPGEVLASATVRDIIAGSGLRFRDREQRLSLPPEQGGGRLALMALAGDERPTETTGRAASPPLPGLSPREREILGLVAQGLSNPAIAAALGLSEHTAKRHVQNILLKLNLPTRAAAAAFAARAGLL